MIDLLDFIESTASVNDLDSLYKVLSAAMLGIGYDRSLFSLMTDHAETGLKAGHGIMRNYPDDWMKHYVEKGMEKYDPVRCFIFRANGPFLWNDLPSVMHYSKLQRNVMEGAHEVGLRSGVAVSLRNAKGEIAALGGANSQGETLDPRAPFILNMFGQHMYFRFIEIHSVNENKTIKMSDREREILSWLAVGKTMPDVAEIVGLSVAGIRHHMKGLFDKLSVPNQTAAVTKAFRAGLISP